ncbi:uncharacterized protein LOC135167345 [Diachasmimorpha longicaudata]|uniref:uncharacterized protein LOC135167345 n=1 Tax=Diachasmimorpha longicaudata TaxID=58733 RepID=UPI0030B8EE62
MIAKAIILAAVITGIAAHSWCTPALSATSCTGRNFSPRENCILLQQGNEPGYISAHGNCIGAQNSNEPYCIDAQGNYVSLRKTYTPYCNYAQGNYYGSQVRTEPCYNYAQGNYYSSQVGTEPWCINSQANYASFQKPSTCYCNNAPGNYFTSQNFNVPCYIDDQGNYVYIQKQTGNYCNGQEYPASWCRTSTQRDFNVGYPPSGYYYCNGAWQQSPGYGRRQSLGCSYPCNYGSSGQKSIYTGRMFDPCWNYVNNYQQMTDGSRYWCR